MKKEKSSAYDYALQLLSKRDYSRLKLTRAMKRRQYDDHDIETAIRTLIEKRYLREDHYTHARIRSLIRKNYGPVAIRQKMAQEGIRVTDSDVRMIYDELGLTPSDQQANILRKRSRQTPEQNRRYLIARGLSSHYSGDED